MYIKFIFMIDCFVDFSFFIPFTHSRACVVASDDPTDIRIEAAAIDGTVLPCYWFLWCDGITNGLTELAAARIDDMIMLGFDVEVSCWLACLLAW